LKKRIKILYITPFFNYPPMDGGSIRSYNIYNELNKSFDVYLLTYPNKELFDLIPNNKLSFFNSKFIFNSKTYFQRLFTNEIPGFSSHNKKSIAKNITKVIKNKGPFDFLYFATQLMAQVLLSKNWNTFNIIDFYDIYSSVQSNKLDYIKKTSPYYILFKKELKLITDYERNIMNRANLLITVSKNDKNEIIYKSLIDKCIVVQNGVRMPNCKWDCSTVKNCVIMVGNFNYHPNIEGLNWFIKKVWPLVNRNNIEIKLMIIGKHNEKDRSITKDYSNIIWKGELRTLDEMYLNAGCAIVPIKQGGGIKHKVLESMSYGTPVITTEFGAKGILHNGALNIKNSRRDFALSIINVIKNPQLHRRKSKIGRSLIRNNYSWPIQYKKLEEKIIKLDYS